MLAFLPAIPFIVRTIEAAFGRKSGQEKLDRAMEVVNVLVPQKASGRMAEGIQRVIEGLVIIFHEVGEFRRTSQPKQG